MKLNDLFESDNNQEAREMLKMTLQNSNMDDALPRIKRAIKLTDNDDVKEILELVLTNSNMDDAKPRIKQAIKKLT